MKAAALASDGDGRMIAAARLRFSDYHFGGGTALFACVISSSPDEAGRRSFPLASCVVVPGRACLICPGIGDCVSSCLPVLVSFPGAVPAACVSLSSVSLGVGYIPGSGHRSLIISSISSSRAAVAVLFSSTSGAASSIGVLSSYRVRLSCGGRRTSPSHPPLPHSRMSWGKRRGM